MPAARLAWLAHGIAILTIALFVAGAIAGGAGELLDDLPFLLFALTTLGVGWFLAWQRPRLPLGWMLLVIPFGLVELSALAGLAGDAWPAIRPWTDVITGGPDYDSMFWVPPIGMLLMLVPLRYPDGKLPSPRWNWFWWYAVAMIVLVPLFVTSLASEFAAGRPNPLYLGLDPGLKDSLGWIVIVGGLLPPFVGSIVSLFVRYRYGDPVSRAQLRWVFWALGIAVGLLVVSWIPNILGIDWLVDLTFGVVGLGYLLVPLSILVAVMRYGLYSIDRIISRTASYALSIAAAVAVYAAIVLLASVFLPGDNPVLVAVATLVAAAVFLPLLRGVQRRLDRRFDRERYDAETVVDAFGARLRTVVDPATTASDLVSAVERTLQPAAVGLWTAGGAR